MKFQECKNIKTLTKSSLCVITASVRRDLDRYFSRIALEILYFIEIFKK